jgi:carbon storage regulator CsrA
MSHLVLSRKLGEAIRLTCDDGTEIVVTVLGWRNRGGIKLGIEAPPAVDILRGELVEREVTSADEH